MVLITGWIVIITHYALRITLQNPLGDMQLRQLSTDIGLEATADQGYFSVSKLKMLESDIQGLNISLMYPYKIAFGGP